jgi:hypothetical protein
MTRSPTPCGSSSRQHQPPRYRRTHQRTGVPERLIQLGQRFSYITDWNRGNPRIRQQHWRARESSPTLGSAQSQQAPSQLPRLPGPVGAAQPGSGSSTRVAHIRDSAPPMSWQRHKAVTGTSQTRKFAICRRAARTGVVSSSAAARMKQRAGRHAAHLPDIYLHKRLIRPPGVRV